MSDEKMRKKKEHIKRCLLLLRDGIDMGKINYKTREKLHHID